MRNIKKQNSRCWQKCGSTLFELMASIAVFSTITLVGVQSVQLTRTMSNQMLVNSGQQSKLEQTLNTITNDLVEARVGLGCHFIGMTWDGAVHYEPDQPENVCYGSIAQSNAGGGYGGIVQPVDGTGAPIPPTYISKYLSFKVPEQTVDGYTSFKVIRYNWYYADHSLERKIISSTGETTVETIGHNIDSIAFEASGWNGSTVKVTVTKGNQVMKADVCLRNR